MACIECGKEDDRFNYLCQDCYLKNHQVIESRSRIKIKICTQCSAAFVRTDWRLSPEAGGEEAEFKDAISDSILYNYKVKPLKELILHIELDNKFVSLFEKPVIVEGQFSLSGKPDAFLPAIQVNEPFNVYIKYRRCHRCSSLDTAGSITVKVQIRGAERQLDEIGKLINIHFKELGASPSSDVTLKDGWDLSFHNTAAQAAFSLTDILRDGYGAQIIKTKETTGYDRIKSKSKTRTVISVRLPRFLPGDIVTKMEQPYQLLSVTGKTIKVYNYLEQEKINWDKELMWDSRTRLLLTREQLTTFQIFAIETRTNSLQVMNLSSYEMYEMSINLYAGDLVEGIEIKGFIWEDKIFPSQL